MKPEEFCHGRETAVTEVLSAMHAELPSQECQSGKAGADQHHGAGFGDRRDAGAGAQGNFTEALKIENTAVDVQ